MLSFIDSINISEIGKQLLYNPQQPLLFNTGLFLLLFAAFYGIYYLLRNMRVLRMGVTILFSLYFYYKSSAECCLLLLAICGIDYLLGNLMGMLSTRRARRGVVVASLLLNLGLLIYFKYFNLLLSTWASMSGSDFEPLSIILPAGISFITFRSISYIIDVYRGDTLPERNILNYIFALTFFPPLLAGPVVRARDLLPQIRKPLNITNAMVNEGFILIMCGLIKKVVIADYISCNFVNRIFDNPALYSGFENLMGCFGFTIQIYCDFSGYSDMAIGLALLLGYRFKQNFDAPFKAQNPSEFWRRWHISLSTWLRDYLYFPLGGSRCSKLRTYFNNFITMVLGGLWHGASWMYLLWGAYQGLLLVLHKMVKSIHIAPAFLRGTLAARIFNICITMALSLVGFVIFRADSIDKLSVIFEQIFCNFHASVIGQFVAGYPLIVVAIVAGYVMHYLPTSWNSRVVSLYGSMPAVVRGLILALVIFIAIQARSSDLVPFIYLQY
ncbi:MAG: MBOAT family O-acyltransferase [Muribaculaceae bacterium]